MIQIVGLADDLSGAAETALVMGGEGSTVFLDASAIGSHSSTAGPGVAVVDLDSRYRSPDRARADLDAVIERMPHDSGARSGGALSSDVLSVGVFKKVDSLLRGNLRAEIAAFTDRGRRVVLAPALPELGRTVVDGVLRIDGRPLAETDLWRAEGVEPPRRVSDLIDGAREGVPLSVVRDDVDTLRRALERTDGGSGPVVVDAETEGDLDAIVAATLDASNGSVLAGSRGLAAAIGRMRGIGNGGSGVPASGSAVPAGRHPLVVVGSGDDAAHRQFDRLAVEAGVAALTVHPDELLGSSRSSADALMSLLAGEQIVAVRVAAPVVAAAPDARALAAAFSELIVSALRGGADERPIVIIGGETARATLSRLGVDRIRILGPAGAHGVSSAASDGRLIVTRPGSFGAEDDLVGLVRTFQASIRPTPIIRARSLVRSDAQEGTP